MSEIKQKIKTKEDELKITGVELSIAKEILVKKANRISLGEKLTAFTKYITRTNLEHNHSDKVIPLIRTIVLKATKTASDKKIGSLEDFLDALKKHIDKYNELFEAKKEAKYQMFTLPEITICKQYLLSFLNDDSVKNNYNIIDQHKKAQIQEEEGSPVVYKAFINLKDRDGKIVETIKVLTNRNISFNSLSVSVEFTNGVKHSTDFYKKSIYTYTNKDSDKMQRDSIFSPVQENEKVILEIESSEILRLIEIDLTKDDIKQGEK